MPSCTPAIRRTAGFREVPAPASVTGRHQDIKLYLTVMIKAFVEMTDAGLVRDAPFQVLLPDGQIYQPDIVFIANSNFDRVHETYLEGPPDIAVEIVSVETTAPTGATSLWLMSQWVSESIG